jgi:hypothetical protein
MNFLEQWFGLAPDGGSGLTEATIVILVLALLVVVRRRYFSALSSKSIFTS